MSNASSFFDQMNVLIIGSGGREHAFAWKIHQSPLCDQLYVAPGNAGTQQVAQNIDLDIMDFEEVLRHVQKKEIQLIVIGPEAPLVAGLADYLEEEMPSLMIIGPKKDGALLEGSKAFAKEFMIQYDIPTAQYLEVTSDNLSQGISHINSSNGPYVLKADGLAAGKGVLIIEDRQEAVRELEEMIGGKFGKASATVVIEEFLSGVEFSVFVLTDGQYYIMLPEAKDYKRIGEGDTGLNTGGMGAISPVPFVDDIMIQKVREQIIVPTLSGLQDRDIEYRGFIFFGLISVGGEPYVIEYNCRMGDPETQVVLPRVQNDFLELCEALYEQDLYETPLEQDPRVAATVVAVSEGYPGSYPKGRPIEISVSDASDSIVFHAGTKLQEDHLVTNGGRVLAVTSLDENREKAIEKSMNTLQSISYQGKYFRADIGFDL